MKDSLNRSRVLYCANGEPNIAVACWELIKMVVAFADLVWVTLAKAGAFVFEEPLIFKEEMWVNANQIIPIMITTATIPIIIPALPPPT
jgi:hypothetical protein